jgi:hypothetical protein
VDSGQAIDLGQGGSHNGDMIGMIYLTKCIGREVSFHSLVLL